ncbi:MAG: VCBS repeat-containing protein [Anaerolineales bacterium]|nr:VCBS repeat-containing protein [Anaerolineales bacterium]
MKHKQKQWALGGLVASMMLAIVALVAPIRAAITPEAMESPQWSRAIPSSACPSGGVNCHRASPALADVNNDGILDIIIATRAGHIVALRHDGSADGAVIFDVDIASAIGMAPNTAVIQSSPAVGDIDNNDGGRPEIVVGFGSDVGTGTKGGVIVLEHNGTVKNGWPRFTIDTHSNGNPKTVFSTPAIGDLDNDGDKEIVVGSFDKRIYAYHHNGSMVAGFPADSALLDRFPTWPNLVGKLADSIWSSPALADLNGDGHLDIVIGTDEGNFDSRYGGNSGGWTCPYTLPAGWAPGYCGGSLYAVDYQGNLLPGFPKYYLEIIQSTPAIADLNENGTPDIFHGTGTFYHVNSPDHPTYGFRVFGLNNNGTTLSGWNGGKVTNNTTPASPAIGDIAGDNRPELIMGDNSGRIFAWNADGSLVSGFPMIPKTYNGQTHNFDVGLSFVLGDIDNDNKQEIIFNMKSSVVIVDGNGQQLTTSNSGADGKPGYTTGGWLVNTPALGDVDDDGRLELIVHDSTLYVWDLPNSNLDTDWPMFKHDAERTSRANRPGTLGPVTNEMFVIPAAGATQANGAIGITNLGDEPLNWSASDSLAHHNVDLILSSGQIAGHGYASVNLVIDDLPDFGIGWHDLGDITVTTTTLSGDPAGSATAAQSRNLRCGSPWRRAG